MNYRFLPKAEQEYEEAFEHYLRIDPALAIQFVAEIEAAIAEIRRQPFLRRLVGGNIRRRLVPRFSFGVYYVCERDMITIAAVMHQSRNPARWTGRQG